MKTDLSSYLDTLMWQESHLWGNGCQLACVEIDYQARPKVHVCSILILDSKFGQAASRTSVLLTRATHDSAQVNFLDMLLWRQALSKVMDRIQ
jgi:hypothetical protein